MSDGATFQMDRCLVSKSTLGMNATSQNNDDLVLYLIKEFGIRDKDFIGDVGFSYFMV